MQCCLPVITGSVSIQQVITADGEIVAEQTVTYKQLTTSDKRCQLLHPTTIRTLNCNAASAAVYKLVSQRAPSLGVRVLQLSGAKSIYRFHIDMRYIEMYR